MGITGKMVATVVYTCFVRIDSVIKFLMWKKVFGILKNLKNILAFIQFIVFLLIFFQETLSNVKNPNLF